MALEKLKKAVEESAIRTYEEIGCINRKSTLSVHDVEVTGKLLYNLEKAFCVMKMAQEVQFEEHADAKNEEYSAGMRMSRSHGMKKEDAEAYSGHSIDDRIVSVLEDMAARAGSDYERKRIEEKIDTLRHM